MKSFTLHDLPPQERPRERLAALGAEALSSQEILALVLGRGTRGEPVMSVAQQLLARFGSLRGISDASLEDLQKIKGLGTAKAAQLQACFQIAKRLEHDNAQSSLNHKARLSDPEKVFTLVKARLRNYSKEHFFVISLDAKNGLLGIEEVSIGTLNGSLVHPRETFEAAIKCHAAAIIVAHNHPSGDPTPSQDDIDITARLKQAGELFGIHLLDHVIVGKNGFHSFQEKGML